MLDYSLNIQEPYGSGGVRPSWQTAISTIGGGGSTIEEKGYALIESAVPGASEVIDLLGIGPEDWAAVESRAKGGLEKLIAHAVGYINSATTPAVGLHKADVYIEMEINRFKFFAGRAKSSNTRNSIALQMKGISDFRETIRKGALNTFNVRNVSVDSRKYSVRQPSGDGFDYNVLPTQVSVKTYTPKQAVKKHVVTSVKPAKIPQTITTTTVAPRVVLPTDSPYLGTDDEGNADDIYKSPWYVIIVVVIIVTVGLGLRWIWKKLKKK
ncbi:hypothetical protein [Tenacibaculum ovolyticum]|uniref:hypothetical protein n=1 Tax=Tenacibaculum ovolyticum TaxID=104270 RepID=UPI001F427BA5|nr:hypothetical protein [Tenacibaculum ovolyticum]